MGINNLFQQSLRQQQQQQQASVPDMYAQRQAPPPDQRQTFAAVPNMQQAALGDIGAQRPAPPPEQRQTFGGMAQQATGIGGGPAPGQAQNMQARQADMMRAIAPKQLGTPVGPVPTRPPPAPKPAPAPKKSLLPMAGKPRNML